MGFESLPRSSVPWARERLRPADRIGAWLRCAAPGLGACDAAAATAALAGAGLVTLLPLNGSGEEDAGFVSTPEGEPLYRSPGFMPRGWVSRWLGR